MVWLFVECALASLLLLSLVFVYAKARNRFDIIDVMWGVAFIVIAATSYGLQLPQRELFFSVQSLITALVIIWGARLAGHIFLRWKSSDKEDKRYSAMRDQYDKKPGGMLANMFGRVFVVQALLAVAVSSSVIVVNGSMTTAVGVLGIIGALIWVIGFYFESVGDYQLKQHLADPRNKGKLMTSGLWKYTRHPNYFGEVTQWWGIFIIALSVPLWWISIIGPIMITVLIVFISGVPMTEKHFEGRDGWDKYKKRTNKFFPSIPKS